jgi:hypothetical protein
VVARVPWAERTPTQKTAIVVMLISTINFLQSIVFGWLSVPGNMILYLMKHGQAPMRPDSNDTRGPDYWVGNFIVVLPWWYFAATGLILLAVSVFLVLRPAYRVSPASIRTLAWRTTPGFLAAISLFTAATLVTVARYHVVLTGPADPYLFGSYAAALGGLISLGAFLVARRRRKAGSTRG